MHGPCQHPILWGVTCNIITKFTASIQRSLLFQGAVNLASEGHSVTFICSEPFRKLPQHVHSMTKPEPTVLKLVKFVYIKTCNELIEYLCSFHMMPVVPDALLVEDVTYYTGQMQDAGREVSIARILVHLKDVQEFMTKKRLPNDLKFQMLLSTQDKNPSHLAVYHKFFQEIWTISVSGNASNIELQLFTRNKDAETMIITLKAEEELWVKEIYRTGGENG
ncbi:uncharacterized protein LOC135488782 isoform X2 [Lineus longissimus]|uniref:uncharacterized protein LOC135488782 isoform X2 n=1 Tax=Lineus longissimus TaxID=88925 RepID=UPI00315CEA9F